MGQEIKVPDIGDFDEVEVIEVLVAEGDEIEQEQALITLESDKATLEVPSTGAGEIAEMKVKEGDKVSQGDVILLLAEQAEKSSKGKEESEEDEEGERDSGQEERDTGQGTRDSEEKGRAERSPEDESERDDDGGEPETEPAGSSRLEKVDEEGFRKAHASPGVRKYARELGVDLGRVEGSGRKGRILVEDVQKYVKKALKPLQSDTPAGGGMPAQPDIDFSQFGEVETVELARIRKISAKAVHRNWLLIPHVTQFDQADITDMEAFRQANKEAAAEEGIKLTPLAFLLKAGAAALKAFPDMNSSLTADGEQLVRKKYCHIAVAVDSENGLMMPVIRDVDKKGIYRLARELGEISVRARDGKLKSDEMKGASFSISSLGGVGGTAFAPIVNSPEVAILGVSRHSWQPIWQDGEFVPRLMLPLSLSYDHRVIDGAKAARITGFFAEVLADLRELLL